MRAASSRRPLTLAITGGDPCGIGPEVILKTLAAWPSLPCRLVVIGNLRAFEQCAKRLRLLPPAWQPCAVHDVSRANDPRLFVEAGPGGRFSPGAPSNTSGEAAVSYLDAALELWRRGAIDGLVTAPVTKWAIERARGRFVGQTEYVAAALRVKDPVMMFTAPRLRVALLTRHVALREVPNAASARVLSRTATVVSDGLKRWFGVRRPRLAVCGLNPHAGERGAFGTEDQRVIEPVVRALRRKGIRLEGPFAADGFFANLYGPSCATKPPVYDAILCWYHDQGLIPFKLMARDVGCQVTLGLPLVRTSPDHGSALEIAGQGVANPGSMRYALHLAVELARHSRRTTPHAYAR